MPAAAGVDGGDGRELKAAAPGHRERGDCRRRCRRFHRFVCLPRRRVYGYYCFGSPW